MDKEQIRKKVWRLMEEREIARFPRPVFNRIPNFVGAKRAARRLSELSEYRRAEAVFCNPDAPQRPVRERVLREGKSLIMATPRLKEGFLLLDPDTIPGDRVGRASTIRGAFEYGRSVQASEVELFVAGSVAVSVEGGRLGKGSGYSDREFQMLRQAGGLASDVVVVTTVHDLQVVEEVPQHDWDVTVDVIVTPTRIIRTG